MCVPWMDFDQSQYSTFAAVTKWTVGSSLAVLVNEQQTVVF